MGVEHPARLDADGPVVAIFQVSGTVRGQYERSVEDGRRLVLQEQHERLAADQLGVPLEEHSVTVPGALSFVDGRCVCSPATTVVMRLPAYKSRE